MTTDDTPQPQSAGALGPPGRRPPTAIGTDTPEPPVPPRPPRSPRPSHAHRHVRVERHVHFGPDLRVALHGALNGALDTLDRVADDIARGLGLRRT